MTSDYDNVYNEKGGSKEFEFDKQKKENSLISKKLLSDDLDLEISLEKTPL